MSTLLPCHAVPCSPLHSTRAVAARVAGVDRPSRVTVGTAPAPPSQRAMVQVAVQEVVQVVVQVVEQQDQGLGLDGDDLEVGE
jgi:hypothetical protein